MEYIFKISAEDLKLSKLELKSLLETYNIKYKIRSKNNFVFVSTTAKEEKINKLCKRSSYLHWCSAVKGNISENKWSWVKPPFCVRIEQGKWDKRAIAGKIWKKLKKPSVDLQNPKTMVYVFGSLATKLIWNKKKNRFANRSPIKKPAFHPTSMKPKHARLLVNLSKCKEKQILLDPFCGTGSILIEAKLIGCKANGSDLDKRMVAGAKLNLNHFKLKAKVKQANALELDKHYKKNSIDAIATDPPYGRSSHVGAKNIVNLYEGFLKSALNVLKKNKYCVLLYPHYVKFKISKKWKIMDRAGIYVHGGLTRKIIVLRKA